MSLPSFVVRALGVFLGGILVATSACAAEKPVQIPAPQMNASAAPGPLQTAVIAGGCFWGVQGVFQHLTGVERVVSGYAGGDAATAHYEMVGSGRTGHAEAVEITFDPQVVTFGEILQVFFSVVHDPTQLNRQGPDSGPQYRSSIFYVDESQQKIAQAYIAQLDKTGAFNKPIVTRVDPLKGFYAAEAYHQDFLVNNPRYPYIVINDLPKVRNFEKFFPAKYQPKAMTLAASR